MARKRKLASDPDGIFRGVSAFFVPHGVEPRRLKVWKQKLVQMGGRVQKTKGAKDRRRTFNHVLAADAKALLQKLGAAWLHSFRGSMVSFEWLEESLKAGERLPEHKFTINYEEEFKPKKAGDTCASNPAKRIKMEAEDHKGTSGQKQNVKKERPTGEHQDTSTHVHEDSGVSENHKGTTGHDVKKEMPTGERRDSSTHVHQGSGVKKEASCEEPTNMLHQNVTEIFGKLINIYRALGDDQSSFSYYMDIPIIEKLPFKIESVQQVRRSEAIVNCHEEKDVFETLGFPWLEPHERNL